MSKRILHANIFFCIPGPRSYHFITKERNAYRTNSRHGMASPEATQGSHRIKDVADQAYGSQASRNTVYHVQILIQTPIAPSLVIACARLKPGIQGSTLQVQSKQLEEAFFELKALLDNYAQDMLSLSRTQD